MFFKNLTFFRLEQPQLLPVEVLPDYLAPYRFQPCTSLQAQSYGWVPPLVDPTHQEGAPLVHVADGRYMLCAQREEKILPASVVNELLAEKILDIEEAKGVKVRKKERDALRDEIFHDLLPRAFSFTRRLYAYLDIRAGWLVIDSASPVKAEELASLLRKSLGSLPAIPPPVKQDPAGVMTGWLRSNGTLGGMSLGSDCRLKGTAENVAEVILRRSDLAAEEVDTLLDTGLAADALALSWRDRLSFTLDTNLRIKRLRFLDLVQAQRADIECEDAAASFDADFTIMAGELAEFIPALVELFGGLRQKGRP